MYPSDHTKRIAKLVLHGFVLELLLRDIPAARDQPVLQPMGRVISQPKRRQESTLHAFQQQVAALKQHHLFHTLLRRGFDDTSLERHRANTVYKWNINAILYVKFTGMLTKPLRYNSPHDIQRCLVLDRVAQHGVADVRVQLDGAPEMVGPCLR